MLGNIETLIYEKYIKNIIVEENGIKKVFMENIENYHLTSQEMGIVSGILKKLNIIVEEDRITKDDRSPYVRDNNYGEVKTNDLQDKDKPVMSTIKYSPTQEVRFADFHDLDEYLETRFIPTYVLLKQKKTENGEIEYFPSIRLHHITALRLSEAEFEHVMEYLKNNNIRVGGKGSTLESEFDNYDYVSTYKESALPKSVSSKITLEKIKLYKETKDKKIREEIIVDNMRLVPYVAYKYAMYANIDQHEIESYGYEGLINALENFDVNSGYAFSTYAVAYIRGKILSGINELLVGKRDRLYYDFVNAKNAVERTNGVLLSDDPELIEDVIELLIATGKISEDRKSVEVARRKINSLVFGDVSLSEDDTFEELDESGEFLDSHDYTEDAIYRMSKDTIKRVLDTLTEREAAIIKLRYGFDGGEPKTYEEIARMFNLSRERIRQIEIKALRKLRHPSRADRIRPYYEDSETEKFSK